MIIFIFGPPGSGKGTYSKKIEAELGIKHLSTGDFFRNHTNKNTELGLKIKEYIDEGELIPDTIVNSVAEKLLNKHENDDIILDGYPRTIEQAKFLDNINKPDIIIKLNVPEEATIKRLSARRVCKECGEIYNLFTKPPENIEKCDLCDGKLISRSDDRPLIVKKRIEDYKKRSQRILNHYENEVELIEITVNEVDANIEKVTNKIIEELKEKKEKN